MTWTQNFWTPERLVNLYVIFITLMLGYNKILQFSFRNMVYTVIVSPVPDAAVRANGLQYYLLPGFTNGKDQKNLQLRGYI